MRARALLVPATALLLGLTLAPVAADPPTPPGDKASSAGRDHRADQAEEALATVRSLVSGASARHTGAGDQEPSLTLALRDLDVAREALPPGRRAEADRYFLRPGQGSDPYIPVALPLEVCSADICVHYTESGVHAPAGSDGDPATVPGYIATVRNTLQSIHDKYVAAGYRAPLPDDGVGGSDHTDVYIGDIGGDGLYGFCNSDDPKDLSTANGYDVWAYCALDDDYASSQFPTNTPLENMRVTAAHEYFHAVQFAYDRLEDGWLLESTAAWVEDELYDSVDDNRQYLANSPLRRPGVPLDTFGADGFHYGTWIFWRYLTERYRTRAGGLPTLVRDVWRRADGAVGRPDDHSTLALQRVLRTRRTTLPEQLALFSAANRHPRTVYDEGRASAYRPAPLAATVVIKPRRTDPAALRGRIDHLTSATLRFVPRKLAARSWKLRLAIDMQDTRRGSAAVITVYEKRGIKTSLVRLDRRGGATRTVPFSTRNVRAVEVTLVNASVRYRDCWEYRTPFACGGGTPRDDDLLQAVDAKAVR